MHSAFSVTRSSLAPTPYATPDNVFAGWMLQRLRDAAWSAAWYRRRSSCRRRPPWRAASPEVPAWRSRRRRSACSVPTSCPSPRASSSSSACSAVPDLERRYADSPFSLLWSKQQTRRSCEAWQSPLQTHSCLLDAAESISRQVSMMILSPW